MVYESLKALGEEERFTRVEGRPYAGNHWGEAFAASAVISLTGVLVFVPAVARRVRTCAEERRRQYRYCISGLSTEKRG